MLNIRKWFIFYIIITILNIALASTWQKIDEYEVASNKLVIKFNNAPIIGVDKPFTKNYLPELNDIISKHSNFQIHPTFSSIKSYNPLYIKHELHQYYTIKFDDPVDLKSIQAEIETLPSINYSEFSYQKKINTVPNDDYYLDQWALNNTGQANAYYGGNVGTAGCDIGAEDAWDVTTGDDEIIIAILDTGVNSHEEFTGRLLQGYDFIGNDNSPTDGNGHGTACAGIAAAKGNNNMGISGICWDCLILPVKIMSDDGFGEDTQIADGVVWSSDNGADVISMSLGGGNFVSYFDNAINYATENGTTVFAASGNDNASTVSYPANYDNCISVGALSPCNERKNYSSCDNENFWGSNYGNGLDFVAPGVRIHTTSNNGGYTSTFNGTSSACPNAAGVAGLILSLDSELTPEAVRTIMQISSVDIQNDGYDLETGWGRINAFYALATIVGGPEVSVIPNEVNLELGIGENYEELLSVTNTGQMDLNINIDPFGYDWKDQSEVDISYEWIDISSDNSTLTFPHNDEAANQSVTLPFNFYYYDSYYSSLIVNANGWIGLGSDNNAWENTLLPNSESPLNAIFPFWDDLNPINESNSTNMEGYVRYHVNSERAVIWFDNVRRWTGGSDMDGYFDFQAVLYPNGNIKFNYRSMSGDLNSSTIGIQNSDGSSGLNVAVNQDYITNNSSIEIKGKPSWLSVSPLNLEIQPSASEIISLAFDTSNLTDGFYSYNLKLNTNDFYQSFVIIPVNLTILDSPCADQVIGDLNNDGVWNVIDIINIVNIILDGSTNDCDYIIGDLNQDDEINVVDIILVVNIILDE